MIYLKNKNIIYIKGIRNKYKINFDKSFEIKKGQIILWNSFPFYDDLAKKTIYKKHFFYIQSITQDNIYLIYMSTKYNKYKNDTKINHNYLISNSNNKNVIFDIKKMYIIDKEWFQKEYERQENILIKHISNYKIQNSLNKLIKNCFLYNENLKKTLINSKGIIKPKNYLIDKEFNKLEQLKNLKEYQNNIKQNMFF